MERLRGPGHGPLAEDAPGDLPLEGRSVDRRGPCPGEPSSYRSGPVVRGSSAWTRWWSSPDSPPQKQKVIFSGGPSRCPAEPSGTKEISLIPVPRGGEGI